MKSVKPEKMYHSARKSSARGLHSEDEEAAEAAAWDDGAENSGSDAPSASNLSRLLRVEEIVMS